MALTPMMNQYLEVKEKYKDCILFYRLGDFYEMFFDDAKIASKELELVLTGRDCGLEERAPMCGIPFHAASSYVGRLINKGYKVAICEQLEDAKSVKGIVRRDVVKVITPGTYNENSALEEDKNNYIGSIFKYNELCGLSFCDISTGDFYSTCFLYDENCIINELSKFNPKELILPEDFEEEFLNNLKDKFSFSYTLKQNNFFTDDYENIILNQFKNMKLKNIDIPSLLSSTGILNYILETQKASLTNIIKFQYYNILDYMNLDINTRKNLELTENIRDGKKSFSLLGILDKTETSMGSRMLRRILEEPLLNISKIDKRLDAVEEIKSSLSLMEDLKDVLKSIYDIERIAGRISSKSVNPKELLALKESISKIPEIKNILKGTNSEVLKYYYEKMDDLNDIYTLLNNSIIENPSISIKEGDIIKEGYSKEVDELREVKLNGKEWIANLESKERDETKIRSLKIGYNKVFGYYIEISKANYSLIPEGRYIRKQTLANAERFITEELKIMEDKILNSEENLMNLEYELFVKVRDIVENNIERIKFSSILISQLDCILSLSKVALENNYVRPKFNEEGYIDIKNGRHPVIEKVLPKGTFISNDTYINMEGDNLLLITGPNMAGKSTYMRQIALIVIMAQIGSFIPADDGDISICDKIFTRIGASDDLSSGKSTFMVEMTEVSNILKNSTKKSLVLFDEVGRGTSTYDGLSIAWAVIEYMVSKEGINAKTLFATHYHELTKLEGLLDGVKNYSVSVKEIGNEIIFLRKIIKGGADESYGIEVAKLAGIPKNVVKRAKEILKKLEYSSINIKNIEKNIDKIENVSEYKYNSVIDKIKNIDITNLTPIDSMNILFKISEEIKLLGD